MSHRSLLLALAAFVAGPSWPGQDSRPAAALRGLDPVDLVAGREVAGNDAISVVHGRFRYAFASEANAAAFRGDPARFEIQWGGACGRMGPLSGRGSPDRFAVHDRRIYVFASDQCRTGFLKAPASFLDPDEPPPEGDAAAREKGAALVARMVAAVGGAARLDAVRTCDASRTIKVKTGDGEREDRVRLRVAGTRHRLDQHWGSWSFTTVVDGDHGFTIGNDGDVEDLDPSAIREFRREMLRNPLELLRMRNRAGFVAVAVAGPEGSPLAWVEIGLGGTKTAVGVDATSGEFREAQHRGRGPTSRFGPLARRFSDWKDAGSLRLPHRVEVDFEGKPVPAETRAYDAIRSDVAIPDATFERPRPN